MQTYTFNGHSIQVEFRAFRALYWLFAGLVVHAGGRTFWPKPDGKAAFTTATDFELTVGGERIEGVVRTLHPIWFLPRVRCSVVVAGTEVARGLQPLRHWGLCYLSWIIMTFGVLFALFGAAVLAYAVWRISHAA